MTREEDEHPVPGLRVQAQVVESPPDGEARGLVILEERDPVSRKADLHEGGHNGPGVVDGVVETEGLLPVPVDPDDERPGVSVRPGGQGGGTRGNDADGSLPETRTRVLKTQPSCPVSRRILNPSP